MKSEKDTRVKWKGVVWKQHPSRGRQKPYKEADISHFFDDVAPSAKVTIRRYPFSYSLNVNGKLYTKIPVNPWYILEADIDIIRMELEEENQ